jgi:hypothetical protein
MYLEWYQLDTSLYLSGYFLTKKGRKGGERERDRHRERETDTQRERERMRELLCVFLEGRTSMRA